eukprot:79149-Hanusia_phi.AAC.1
MTAESVCQPQDDEPEKTGQEALTRVTNARMSCDYKQAVGSAINHCTDLSRNQTFTTFHDSSLIQISQQP